MEKIVFAILAMIQSGNVLHALIQLQFYAKYIIVIYKYNLI